MVEKPGGIEKPRIILKPSITILCGPPLTGKSTFAKTLTRITNASYNDIDAVRLEQHPFHNTDEILEKEVELKHSDIATSALCHWALNEVIRRKQPVIITATFSLEKRKEMMKKLINEAHQHGIPVTVFQLIMDDALIADARIKRRKVHGDLSNIKSQKSWEWAQTLFTPFPADFPSPVHLINSARPMHKNLKEIIQIISKELLSLPPLQNLIVPLVTPLKLDENNTPIIDKDSLTNLINHIIAGIKKAIKSVVGFLFWEQ